MISSLTLTAKTHASSSTNLEKILLKLIALLKKEEIILWVQFSSVRIKCAYLMSIENLQSATLMEVT